MADECSNGLKSHEQGTYDVTFHGDHTFRLLDRSKTFHVSRAGIALGDHLVRNLRASELTGRILEVGTGSGAIALLLRRMGATEILATDISASSVQTAKENELVNFGSAAIDFRNGDLFPDGAGRFDLIVFNPPGWRTPSNILKAELDKKRHSLDLDAMFYGDNILLRFLHQLPKHLTAGGRAVIGLNSLIGIDDILHRGHDDLRSRLMERLEFPLFFYTDEWAEVRASLLSEFERGRQEYAASYVAKGDTIHWFYEITEVAVDRVPLRGDFINGSTAESCQIVNAGPRSSRTHPLPYAPTRGAEIGSGTSRSAHTTVSWA